MSAIDFMAQAQDLRDQLVTWRRDFHQHPETAFEELRTSGIVAQTLGSFGLEVQTGVGKTGVIGILEGEGDGPTVLVRADMDALPIQEENETEYVSTIPGKMHACGHDGHTAIALGVAKMLSGCREQIAGRVKFVFQPAEEVGKGAKAMIEDGALENPRPDVSLGLHLWNELPLGTLGVSGDAVMAGASIVKIKIVGKGGHAGLPDQSVDPIMCAAQLITTLQTIVSRNLNPLDSGVISVTKLHSGTAFNVIPQEAHLEGTIRVFSMKTRETIDRRIQEITHALCDAMGCTAEVTIQHFTNPVVNNPGVAERLQQIFDQVTNHESPMMDVKTMAGEDVHMFMDDVPGTFFFVGSANAEKSLDYPHHHTRFDFDEDVLPLAAGLMSSAVADYVIPENQS